MIILNQSREISTLKRTNEIIQVTIQAQQEEKDHLKATMEAQQGENLLLRATVEALKR